MQIGDEKKIMKRNILLLIVCFITLVAKAQTAESRLRISVLTCAPGGELYATFGHTAIRVTDSTKGTDIIFNYGTFDFDDPDFYTKFVRGTLDYFLSVETPQQFAYAYQMTGRSVWEQVLNLTSAQKQKINDYLLNNLQGNNKFYRYKFLEDNCTTRIRDILQQEGGFTITKNVAPINSTYRSMLHEYLDKSGMAWTAVGFDLLLGASTDKKVNRQEALFLPDYFLKGLDSASIPFVKEKKYFVETGVLEAEKNNSFPLILCSAICAILCIPVFLKQKFLAKVNFYINSLLLYLTGVIGFLLIFLWFFTDHAPFANNYNLLWALPFNLIAAFFLSKKPNWLGYYFTMASAIQGILVFCWFLLPQELNLFFLPIVVMMLFHYVSMSNLRKKNVASV